MIAALQSAALISPTGWMYVLAPVCLALVPALVRSVNAGADWIADHTENPLDDD